MSNESSARSSTPSGKADGPPVTAENEAHVHYRQGCAAWRAERFGLVERHLLEAVRLEPQNPWMREGLALWFHRQNEFERALEHITAARALQPQNIQFTVTHAEILVGDGKAIAGWELLAPLISAGVCGTRLARVFAKIAPKVAQEQRALAYIEQNLRMPGLVQPSDAPRLRFAAAALLDGMGRYDEAFAQARVANQAANRKFDRLGYAQSISHRINYYTKQRLSALPRATHGNRRAVLIVGMPRSGTSLVEQILATHPAVFGGGESTCLVDIVLSAPKLRWSNGQPFPDCSDFMSLQNANELADPYLSALSASNTSATYVTDKMPMNFLLLGAVESILPDIRVIHCTRDARDTCLSCYFTDFGTRHDFAFDLGDLASVYRDYRRLMAHWRQVLTLPMLDVRYEDLVSDQRGQTQRMLDFLNLPWDARCMAFHENNRPVATASREQVRQPMYASSVGRWKHYRNDIAELLSLETDE